MNDKILRAINNIDDDLILGAQTKTRRRTNYFKWAAPVAACLVITIAIAVPTLLKQSQTTGGGDEPGNVKIGGAPEAPGGGNTGDALTGSVPGSAAVSSPGLSLDSTVESAACYAALEDWRGLPAESYVLNEQIYGIVSDRMVYTTLDNLAGHAGAFVLIASVHETAQDGENMQTSIAEYAEMIGGRLDTLEWDDRTVSTGSQILIRQRLIGGCTMDEPNNLLREGGVYLLPITFNPIWGAYETVGDLDVLFELNSEGKIVSHSQWEGFNKYDGMSLTDLLDDVRALYPAKGE